MVEQAKKTGKYLKSLNIHFDKIFTSPLKRAVETCTIINDQINSEIVKSKILIEADSGIYRGKTPAE